MKHVNHAYRAAQSVDPTNMAASYQKGTAFHAVPFLLSNKRDYSYRNAVIGSRPAALRAGHTPNTTPTVAENANAMATDW